MDKNALSKMAYEFRDASNAIRLQMKASMFARYSKCTFMSTSHGNLYVLGMAPYSALPEYYNDNFAAGMC